MSNKVYADIKEYVRYTRYYTRFLLIALHKMKVISAKDYRDATILMKQQNKPEPIKP